MTQFQDAIEAVLKAHNLLEWFYSGKKFYARLDHPYFDRLEIERKGRTFTVGRYFLHDDDKLSDPEANFHIQTLQADSMQAWIPLVIIKYLGEEKERFTGPSGEIPTEAEIPAKAQAFLSNWAREITAQRWVTQATLVTSRWSAE